MKHALAMVNLVQHDVCCMHTCKCVGDVVRQQRWFALLARQSLTSRRHDGTCFGLQVIQNPEQH